MWTKGESLFDAEFIFENTEKFNEIKVLNQDSALILSFFKEIVNNHYCDKEKYFSPASKVFYSQEPHHLGA